MNTHQIKMLQKELIEKVDDMSHSSRTIDYKKGYTDGISEAVRHLNLFLPPDPIEIDTSIGVLNGKHPEYNKMDKWVHPMHKTMSNENEPYMTGTQVYRNVRLDEVMAMCHTMLMSTDMDTATCSEKKDTNTGSNLNDLTGTT